MKVALVAANMLDNNIEEQLLTMENYMKSHGHLDFLIFGESYLQGFEGLSWDYDIDINRALSLEDDAINHIRKLAKKYSLGLSFSFIEKHEGDLYCSNLIIDKDGNTLDLFRRVSPGWKEPIATSRYKEGSGFHTFTYEKLKLLVGICGDLWYEENLSEIIGLNPDLILWPLYIDFSIEDWERKYRFEYEEKVKNINCPILMVNSYVEDENGANGGSFVFLKGKIIEELPMVNMGVLEFDFIRT